MSPWLSHMFLRSQTDERLVELAQAGSAPAFGAIVERYSGELYARARRLGPDVRAEDLVQQTFMSAFEALRSGTDVTHLRGWLHQILRNAAIRTQPRQDAPLEPNGGVQAGESLEDTVQRRMLAFEVLSELSALPGRQRDALVASALHGKGRSEIAASMGLTEGAVRQLVHRARTTLRSAITALTPYPLAQWLVSSPAVTPGTGELVAGAGTASAGGLAVKLAALAASGVAATGIVSSQLSGRAAEPRASGHRQPAQTFQARPGAPSAAAPLTRPPAAAMQRAVAVDVVEGNSSLLRPPAGSRSASVRWRPTGALTPVARRTTERPRRLPTERSGRGESASGGSDGATKLVQVTTIPISTRDGGGTAGRENTDGQTAPGGAITAASDGGDGASSSGALGDGTSGSSVTTDGQATTTASGSGSAGSPDG